MNHNATDDHNAIARSERAIDTVATGHTCPLGTPWCSDHRSEDGGEQCVSRSVDASPRLGAVDVSVWVTQEPGMAPSVAVDGSHGAELSLAAARALLEGIAGLLEEVGR